MVASRRAGYESAEGMISSPQRTISPGGPQTPSPTVTLRAREAQHSLFTGTLQLLQRWTLGRFHRTRPAAHVQVMMAPHHSCPMLAPHRAVSSKYFSSYLQVLSPYMAVGEALHVSLSGSLVHARPWSTFSGWARNALSFGCVTGCRFSHTPFLPLQILSEKRIMSAPVVDEGSGEFHGFLSASDVVGRLLPASNLFVRPCHQPSPALPPT